MKGLVRAAETVGVATVSFIAGMTLPSPEPSVTAATSVSSVADSRTPDPLPAPLPLPAEAPRQRDLPLPRHVCQGHDPDPSHGTGSPTPSLFEQQQELTLRGWVLDSQGVVVTQPTIEGWRRRYCPYRVRATVDESGWFEIRVVWQRKVGDADRFWIYFSTPAGESVRWEPSDTQRRILRSGQVLDSVEVRMPEPPEDPPPPDSGGED